jgi:signal peptidase II
MSALTPLIKTPNRRIALIAAGVVCLDQLTKALVQHWLGAVGQEKIVVPGFFKFVHWQNTGAAWSIFRDNNTILALVAVFALGVLYFSRHHFDVRTPLSQAAFGLICGGIVGNLIDRILEGHVIDFLYFYLQQRGGGEIGFPAFNVADSAICTGVGLVFLLSLKADRKPKEPESAPAK